MRYLMAMALTLAWLGSASAAEIYCTTEQSRDCSDRPSPGSVVVRVTTAQRNAVAAAAQAVRAQPGCCAASAATSRSGLTCLLYSGPHGVSESRTDNAPRSRTPVGCR